MTFMMFSTFDEPCVFDVCVLILTLMYVFDLCLICFDVCDVGVWGVFMCLITFDVFWWVLLFDVCVWWRCLMCFNVFWCVLCPSLMGFDVFWCVLMCFDVFDFVLMCLILFYCAWCDLMTLMHLRTSMCSDVFWSALLWCAWCSFDCFLMFPFLCIWAV